MSHHKYSRRNFLGTMPCMAVGSTTLFSSLINLKAINNIMASTSMMGGDYKALVCVLLSGGNDSFNMIVPKGNAEYNDYANVRSNQAIPQNDLLAINPNTTDGREFGLHPAMGNIQSLFNNGKVAFVNNVGTLIEPTSKSGVLDSTSNLPLGLLSHSDQVMHWQTAFPQDRANLGWGGKMADIIKSMNSNDNVSMNISLGGNNVFQRGETVTEYAINNDGGVAIEGWNNPAPFFQLMTEDVTDMINRQYEDVFKDSYTGVLKRSIESNEVFNNAIANLSPFTTQFSNNNRLSRDLSMVAQSIAARDQLGAERQIFFVELGGFDNHDELLNNHGLLMETIDTAFAEFYAATEELGLSDCVTTYTISDFGRTLTSNGNGTDHAWGGNTIVMGGAVNGKEMYGEYPEIKLNTELELGGGVMLPITASDQYFAELALWFGISPNDLSQVLPNIGNFYNVASGEAPLGFLG